MTAKRQAKQLHPELRDNTGFSHLFFVKAGVHPEEQNIGKFGRFKTADCLIKRETFVIGSLQFNFAGELCYRVYFGNDDFGTVARPQDIVIFEDVPVR